MFLFLSKNFYACPIYYISSISKGEIAMPYASDFGLPSSHGVYVYDKVSGMWSPVSSLHRAREGFSIVYFKNIRCSACREFDKYWTRFVEITSARYVDTDFYLVVCGWFAGNCNSKYAKALFQIHDIYASPSLLFLYYDGKSEKIIEKISGVLNFKQLEMIYEIIRTLTFGLNNNISAP